MRSGRQLEIEALAAVPALPKRKLTLLALFVLTAHALLLGLLQGIRSTAVDGIADSLVFQTRLVALASPQSALPAVAPTPAQPIPEPQLPKPRPAPHAVVRADGIEYTPPSNTSGIESLTVHRGVVAAATPQGGEQAVVLPGAISTSMGALDAGMPESRSTARLPRPATITYQAYVTQNSPQGAHSTALVGTLDWRHDGQSFDLRWRLFGAAAGDRARIATATGKITQSGLMPVSVQDNPTALLPDTQVPVSALIEAGVLIASNPSHYPVGSQFAVSDGVGVDALATTFLVADDDDFTGDGDYEGERLPALHLLHEPAGEQDAHVELWLGQTLDYLPVGLLIVRPGQRLTMTLVSAQGRRR